MQIKQQEMARFMAERFLANHQFVWVVGDETYSYETAVQEAAELLKKERQQSIQVMKHDKLCGFYKGVATLVPPADKSNMAMNAIPMMISDENDMRKVVATLGTNQLPFDPKHDIIFILKDWEKTIKENPLVLQAFRNVIQANMCSNAFYENERSGVTSRGKRMIVLITATEEMPTGFPEVKPIYVSLPDSTILAKALGNVLDPLAEDFDANKGKRGVKAVTKEVRNTLMDSLKGMTYQFAEDTVSFAIARHRNLDDIDAVLATIEAEKSMYIAGVPGLQYISKDDLTPVSQLPGLEPVVNFIRECMSISPEDAEKRHVKRLQGLTIAGAPGTAKTTIGMAVAQETDSILLIWSPGESQGSLVGESEAHTRKVIDIANAIEATVLVDDLDKAGVSIASGASSASVEGGPFGRMIQMLLTNLSSKNNKAKYVFTMNRIKNVPPELIRPGRMDERFFIARPDEKTREQIMTVHILKRGYQMNKDAESMVRQLADKEFTDGWTGAELEDLVKKAVRRSLYLKQDKLDYVWMTKTAKNTTPMIRQEAYAADIEEMEKFCRTWTTCGLRNEEVAVIEKPRTRASRQVG